MKIFLKLIFLGIVIAIAWNYMDNNHINIKDKFFVVKDWIHDQLKDLGSMTETATESNLSETVRETDVQSDVQKSRIEEMSLAKNIIHNQITYGRIDSNVASETPVQDIRNESDADQNNTNGANTDNIEWVKNATKTYSPDSWDLLMKYESLPARSEAPAVNIGSASTEKTTDTFHYLEGSSKIELISSMATDVHEIGHGYCNQNIFRYSLENGLMLDMERAEIFLYYSQEKSFFISFPLKSLFPSRELGSSIPENLHTFRFNTYIDGNTSTQREGIIGLLDEFHSYYLESKFSYEMLEVYKTSVGSDAAGFFEWVHHAQSTMTAFYEFDFFIKEYLLHMKSDYPTEYMKLKNYRPFIEAYDAIHSSYEEVINNYMQLINNEMVKLNSSAKGEARIEDNQLWVRTSNSNTSNGTPIFSEDRDKLKQIISGNRYQEIINDFQIMGLK